MDEKYICSKYTFLELKISTNYTEKINKYYTNITIEWNKR